MLEEAYGEATFSRSKSFEWYTRFHDGQESFDDNPRSGPHSSVWKKSEVCNHFQKDCQLGFLMW